MKEVLISEAPPTPEAVDIEMDAVDCEAEDVYEVDDSVDDYEIPQFVPGGYGGNGGNDGNGGLPSEVPDDLFETPCFLKRRRLRQKTAVSPEHILIHSGSSDETETLFKNEKKRAAKSAKAAAAKAAKAAALLPISKSSCKKKGKNL